MAELKCLLHLAKLLKSGRKADLVKRISTNHRKVTKPLDILKEYSRLSLMEDHYSIIINKLSVMPPDSPSVIAYSTLMGEASKQVHHSRLQSIEMFNQIRVPGFVLADERHGIQGVRLESTFSPWALMVNKDFTQNPFIAGDNSAMIRTRPVESGESGYNQSSHSYRFSFILDEAEIEAIT